MAFRNASLSNVTILLQMKNLFIIISLFAVAFSACGDGAAAAKQSDEAAQQAAWDGMMAIHDEVMPNMGDMNRISQYLKNYVEKKGDAIDASMKERIAATIKELEAGDEGMMGWMNNIKQLSELRASMSGEEIMTYLSEQTNQIGNVKATILKSMDMGNKVLEEIKMAEKGSR